MRNVVIKKTGILLYCLFCLLSPTLFGSVQQAKQAIAEVPENIRLEFDYTFLEGIRYKIAEDYVGAMRCFERCMVLYPGSAAVRYEIANILFQVESDNEKPLRLMREAVQIEPDNIWYQLLLASIYHRKAMIDSACEVYLNLIRKYPEREEYYFVVAELNISVEKWEAAISVLDLYEKQFGMQEMSTIEKSRLYNKSGNLKKASAELARLINTYPDNQDYVGLLAELYLHNKQEKKGLSILLGLLKKDPDNGFIQFYLADYYFEKKDTVSADRYLMQALTNDQVDNTAKVQYLFKLLVQGEQLSIQPARVEAYLQVLLNRYPDDLPVRMMQADLLKQQGDWDGCRQILESVLSQDRSNFLIWEEILLLCNQLNDTLGMRQVGLECIAYFPDEPLPYIMVGIPYLVNEQETEAIPYFEKGLSVSEEGSPIKSQFYSYLGDCYYRLDSVQKAFTMFDEALKINPNDLQVLNNYSYYLSLRGERLSDAERMSSATVAAQPDNATFLDTYAWILFKRKEYSLARFYIQSAVEKSEEPSAVMFEHYGDILYMTGENEQARAMWEKAKSMGGEVTDQLEDKLLHGMANAQE